MTSHPPPLARQPISCYYYACDLSYFAVVCALLEPNPGDATAPRSYVQLLYRPDYSQCPNSQTLKFHSPVSPDPLNARSLRSLGFPKSPPSKNPRSATVKAKFNCNCRQRNTTMKLYTDRRRVRSPLLNSFFIARRYATAVLATVACLCLSVRHYIVGVLSKRLNESIWFWRRSFLPSVAVITLYSRLYNRLISVNGLCILNSVIKKVGYLQNKGRCSGGTLSQPLE